MEVEEEQSVDGFPNTSFPGEVIEEILSRLPVKSILRFRSVCNSWLSRISDPSFTKLYFTRATTGNRTALLVSAFDDSTRKLHILSAAHDGALVTHLMTVDCGAYCTDVAEAQYLNGLVLFTCGEWVSGYDYVHAFVLNPSTRKIFTLPNPTNFIEYVHMGYLFGFDESRNEHKIVHIRNVRKSNTIEIMIFSMSDYSWRKIDVDDFSNWDRLRCNFDGGVCVNSVVHLMLHDLSFDILAFDLKTEKLSIISIPQGVVPHKVTSLYTRNGNVFIKHNIPRIMKINGCVGVVCHDRLWESNEIDIWMLQDFDDRVWVKETIEFPESWIELDGPIPLLEDISMDEILFSLRKSKASENVMIIPKYNMKSRCFKLLQITLDNECLCSKTVMLNRVRCYVESIMSL